MSTCLRCDQCSAVVGETDDELGQWWRIERYGMSWVNEPQREAPMMVAPMVVNALFDADDEDLEDEIEMIASMPADITLHFCKAACMGAWALEAAVMDA